MADRFAVGGKGSQPAITIAGRTVSYGQLESMIERDVSPVADLAAVGVVETLAAVFAAARSGAVVLVRPPGSLRPVLPDLPPDAFLVALTSGTSGRPRGVVRTAYSWSSSFRPLAEIAGLTRHDTVLLTGPLHSTLHLFAAVHTLWLGAHLTDDPATATAAHVVPTVLADLVVDPPPRLRVAVVAGAHLPVRLERLAAASGVRLVEYYGAAELSFVAARVAPAALTAFPGVEVRIVDGELTARSPYLAMGRLPTAPDHGLVPIADADGFASAGDLAAITADDGILIRGRGDAAINTGGHTVLAEDVEAVIGALPGVRAVVVVGVPHARLGQVVAAVVELTDDTDLRATRDRARRTLVGPAFPRFWESVAALPRTDGGKVARSLVAESFSGLHPASGTPVERPVSARSVR